jgi:hypothetical protein
MTVGEKRLDRIPFIFGIKSPTGELLERYILVCNVNPESLDIRMVKKIERIQTKTGWMEQHWGEELDEINAVQSTGAFIDPVIGVTGEAILRRGTIAYDNFQDLIELYRNNGSIYDDSGNIIFQGKVILNYGGAVGSEYKHEGYFINFSVSEGSDSPHKFEVNWTFKAEKSAYHVGYNGNI